MDIKNLSVQPSASPAPPTNLFSPLVIVFVLVIGLVSGFWLSRFSPSGTPLTSSSSGNGNSPLSADSISSQAQLQVGKLYGSNSNIFTDAATGVLEKGNINGEGTHILAREGGLSQRAALTSATLDLDLFVGKKVEIHGQTNTSKKSSWLMDVGSIKILE